MQNTYHSHLPHVIQLAYLSQAAGPLTRRDLFDIIQSARRFNDAHNITGILAYFGNQFVQILEGTTSAMETVMGRITKDARHMDVTVFHQEACSERLFSDWRMGFCDVNAHLPLTQELKDLVDAEPNSRRIDRILPYFHAYYIARRTDPDHAFASILGQNHAVSNG